VKGDEDIKEENGKGRTKREGAKGPLLYFLIGGQGVTGQAAREERNAKTEHVQRCQDKNP